jgi:hypothetical protein
VISSRWNPENNAGIFINNSVNGAGNIFGTIYSVNDNNNVKFNSLEVKGNNVFDKLYDDTQTYGTFSGTKTEFLNAIGFAKENSESEITTGWNTSDANGIVTWTHAPFGYEQFLATQQNSTQDMTATGFGIPWQFLDWNKNGVFNVAEGDGIVLKDSADYEIHAGIPTVGGYAPAYADFSPRAAYQPPEFTLYVRTISVLDSLNIKIHLDIETGSFQLPGSTNSTFRIASTTNLVSALWATNTPIYSVTGAVTTVSLTNSSESAFFKIVQ